MSSEMAKRARSKTEVPASPFNPVKLELALALVLGASLVVAAPRLVEGVGAQLALLGAYGALVAGWVTLRTRRILRDARRGGEF